MSDYIRNVVIHAGRILALSELNRRLTEAGSSRVGQPPTAGPRRDGGLRCIAARIGSEQPRLAPPHRAALTWPPESKSTRASPSLNITRR